MSTLPPVTCYYYHHNLTNDSDVEFTIEREPDLNICVSVGVIALGDTDSGLRSFCSELCTQELIWMGQVQSFAWMRWTTRPG